MFASLVQGSAGELTRFSLVRLWYLQVTGRMPALTTSTVHDEIQVDCDVADAVDVARVVRTEMEDFAGMFGPTPVIADLEITTTNWADKKEMEI
jgi:DNA polymerase I-like protein with 3'-5' exonuclease and polymerase domains